MAGIKNILKKIEETMAAAAFAEAGDFDTARQMIGAGKNSNKRILLGMEQEYINEKMIRNAMQLCQRMGGKLEIFHLLESSSAVNNNQRLLPVQKAALLASYKSKFENMGMYYQCRIGKGCLAEEIIKYIENRRDILCVVFGNHAKHKKQCQSANEKLMALLQKLKCPLVVYAAT